MGVLTFGLLSDRAFDMDPDIVHGWAIFSYRELHWGKCCSGRSHNLIANSETLLSV